MDWKLILWILLGVVGFSAFMYVFSAFVASYCVYTKTLKRQSAEQWSRTPQVEGIAKEMFDEGMAWHQRNLSAKRDLHIVNDGLNLYGEYYDFGSDKCVIILSGRSESLTYGYYFAEPYAKFGLNVLVIDPRAHGMSDGTFNTVGFEESRDALAWAEHIHRSFGIKSILFHGICIGAAAGIFALTSQDCPDYIDGIVAEGMFANFGESMKNHIIERKKPLFLTYPLINMWMKRYTGHHMDYGPIDVIAKQTKPILLLHGKKDLYSLPEYAEKLFDLCPAKNKSIVWFEEGEHSLLRPTNKQNYDDAIVRYLSQVYTMIKL